MLTKGCTSMIVLAIWLCWRSAWIEKVAYNWSGGRTCGDGGLLVHGTMGHWFYGARQRSPTARAARPPPFCSTRSAQPDLRHLHLPRPHAEHGHHGHDRPHRGRLDQVRHQVPRLCRRIAYTINSAASIADGRAHPLHQHDPDLLQLLPLDPLLGQVSARRRWPWSCGSGGAYKRTYKRGRAARASAAPQARQYYTRFSKTAPVCQALLYRGSRSPRKGGGAGFARAWRAWRAAFSRLNFAPVRRRKRRDRGAHRARRVARASEAPAAACAQRAPRLASRRSPKFRIRKFTFEDPPSWCALWNTPARRPRRPRRAQVRAPMPVCAAASRTPRSSGARRRRRRAPPAERAAAPPPSSLARRLQHDALVVRDGLGVRAAQLGDGRRVRARHAAPLGRAADDVHRRAVPGGRARRAPSPTGRSTRSAGARRCSARPRLRRGRRRALSTTRSRRCCSGALCGAACGVALSAVPTLPLDRPQGRPALAAPMPHEWKEAGCRSRLELVAANLVGSRYALRARALKQMVPCSTRARHPVRRRRGQGQDAAPSWTRRGPTATAAATAASSTATTAATAAAANAPSRVGEDSIAGAGEADRGARGRWRRLVLVLALHAGAHRRQRARRSRLSSSRRPASSAAAGTVLRPTESRPRGRPSGIRPEPVAGRRALLLATCGDFCAGAAAAALRRALAAPSSRCSSALCSLLVVGGVCATWPLRVSFGLSPVLRPIVADEWRDARARASSQPLASDELRVHGARRRASLLLLGDAFGAGEAGGPAPVLSAAAAAAALADEKRRRERRRRGAGRQGGAARAVCAATTDVRAARHRDHPLARGSGEERFSPRRKTATDLSRRRAPALLARRSGSPPPATARRRRCSRWRSRCARSSSSSTASTSGAVRGERARARARRARAPPSLRVVADLAAEAPPRRAAATTSSRLAAKTARALGAAPRSARAAAGARTGRRRLASSTSWASSPIAASSTTPSTPTTSPSSATSTSLAPALRRRAASLAPASAASAVGPAKAAAAPRRAAGGRRRRAARVVGVGTAARCTRRWPTRPALAAIRRSRSVGTLAAVRRRPEPSRRRGRARGRARGGPRPRVDVPGRRRSSRSRGRRGRSAPRGVGASPHAARAAGRDRAAHGRRTAPSGRAAIFARWPRCQRRSYAGSRAPFGPSSARGARARVEAVDDYSAGVHSLSACRTPGPRRRARARRGAPRARSWAWCQSCLLAPCSDARPCPRAAARALAARRCKEFSAAIQHPSWTRNRRRNGGSGR